MRIRIFTVLILCINLTFCASAQKKVEEAREKDPRYQYNMGLFHLQNDNPDEAMIYFRKSIRLDPKYTIAYNSMGMSYLIKGTVKEAEKYFLKCLEVDPSFSEAHNNLGTVYQELGLLDKAEDSFRRALRDGRYRSRNLPYFNLGKLFYLQKKFKEAIYYVNQAILLEKTMVIALNLKGILSEELENYPAAIDSYKNALEHIPPDNITLETQIKFNLAVSYFKNKEHFEAKELFLEILPKVINPEIKIEIDKYLKIINN